MISAFRLLPNTMLVAVSEKGNEIFKGVPSIDFYMIS